MDVLVLESERGAAGIAIEELAAAGHRVLRCHEPGDRAFPCAGLLGSCPMDREPIDVALTVRPRADKRPAPLEDGIVCALRSHVPVVVAGRSAFNPFTELGATALDAGRDVVEACETAARSQQRRHAVIANRPLRATLRRAAVHDADTAVTRVRREGGRLHVTLHVPRPTPPDVRRRAAVRVAGALRAFDHSARGIDLSTEDLDRS